ncbi:DUF829 domain-containing protein, partial [archaeon]
MYIAWHCVAGGWADRWCVCGCARAADRRSRVHPPRTTAHARRPALCVQARVRRALCVRARRFFRAMEEDESGAPALYIYSDADAITEADKLAALIQRRRAAGHAVVEWRI